MNITLDLYGPAQLRAFAVFLNACADDYASQSKDKEAYAFGGIDSSGLKGWVNSASNTDGAPSTADMIATEAAEITSAKMHSEQEAKHPEDYHPTRKRGEPSPGHKRRTKAEIAEDEAAEKANAAGIVTGTDTPAAISTGGERVAPDDEPEVEQQDVADEAAETAKAGAELSHDDVRNAMGQYVTKFGMDAAQIDIPKVFQLALKDTAVTKVSLIPGDQASLKKAVDGVMEMLTKNPFSRDAVA